MRLRLPARLSLWSSRLRLFSFQDTGPLIDGELELVPPDARWIDAILCAGREASTIEQAPDLACVTRAQLLEFLAVCPNGHQPAGVAGAESPTYHFWMHAADRPRTPICGSICLRVGNTYDLVMYYGHVGYHVYPFARGRHFAQRSCRLLLNLAARHGIDPVWITCNPDNLPSRRTCQGLGAELVETVQVPPGHPLHQRGEFEKCRFRVEVHQSSAVAGV